MSRRGGKFQSVEEILAQQGKGGRKGSPFTIIQLVEIWPELVGATLAAQSCPSQLRYRTLTIHVQSPVWAQEMQLMSDQLLHNIAGRFPKLGIQKIRFHVA